MTDKFQKRYLAHQKRKTKVLQDIIKERHSDRQFGDGDIDIGYVLREIAKTPSSCDRKAIEHCIIYDKDDKNLLGGLLVGGIGWIHRARYIVLLFANRTAYKAGNEIEFMPYLDTGVIVGMVYLVATSKNYACCFVNPNIREKNEDIFNERFGFGDEDLMFCGAIALGEKRKE